MLYSANQLVERISILEQLISSIKNELLTLPDYDVYPGHGPQTTIVHEKMFNPFLH